MQEYIVEIKNLCKYFAGVKALDDVSLGFVEGEIHALCGENGAGKSTLIKMLTGALEPTSGEIILRGERIIKLNPIEAIEKGISTIYQEFNLVPYLTVAENVFYGKEIKKSAFIDINAMNAEVKKYLEEMEIDLNPKARVCDLGVAYQQIIEIVKAVSAKSKILIMDEPTAPLTNKETQVLFKIIQKLKKDKVTIIYISHRMEEIFEICDRVTVMRDGKHIVTKEIGEIDRKQLISYMVGRELGEKFPESQKEKGPVVLEVKNFSNRKIKNVSFQLKQGEILGFGGLVGAGRTEVMQAVYGADEIQTGSLTLRDKTVKIKSPGDALRHGIGLIPEDRKNQGVLLGLSVQENITFSSIHKVQSGLFIDNKKDIQVSNEYKDKLRIKTPTIRQLLKNLSGGNQQKVVLAKMLATDCDILIFDEPTRGIDVGAKQEIYQLMRTLADDEGKSIIMVSSEMPELIGMSDRILVMRYGSIVGELNRNEFSQERILEYASGLIGGIQ
jgi:ribose transport system ATP-binding protein